jgi:hypothetical protein
MDTPEASDEEDARMEKLESLSSAASQTRFQRRISKTIDV